MALDIVGLAAALAGALGRLGVASMAGLPNPMALDLRVLGLDALALMLGH